MAKSVSFALAVAFAAATIVLRAQGVVPPQQPKITTPAGTGAITGVVVDAATNRPIAGATVRLDNRPPGGQLTVWSQVTTPTGRFAFLELPQSDGFVLTTLKAGYLDGGNARIDPRGPSVPLALAEAQWIGGVRLRMSKPGSISGTVLDERGEPVVDANVRVLSEVMMAGRPQWLPGPVAWTDDRGAYRIGGLGAGRYVVQVPSVQATLPMGAKLLDATAAAATSRADLVRMREAASAEKLLVPAGNGLQVVAGRYAVPPPVGRDGRRLAYPLTFFPNQSELANASTIELGPGDDRTGVDFSLQPVQTARVSGRLVGSAEAVAHQLLRLIPQSLEELGQGSEAASTVTTVDGRFSFVDVPSGRYKLVLRHSVLELTYASMRDASTAAPRPLPFPARSAAAFDVRAAPNGVEGSALNDMTPLAEWGEMTVDVDGRDLDDVVLVLRKPLTLSGRFVWADGEKSDRAPRVYVESAQGRRSLGMPTSNFTSNTTTFTIDGLMAGEYVLRCSSATVESVVWEGRDYTDRPFDASGARDITGVVITLSTKSSSVAGTVSDGGDRLKLPAAVIAYPVESDAWSNYGFNPTRLLSVVTTAAGGFRVNGLPRGEYFLLAVPMTQERAWLDPGFLASHTAAAVRVRIERSDANVTGVAVKLLK